MNHLEYLALYIEQNWPLAAFMLGAAWGSIVWAKRQFLDNVYAKKSEVVATERRLEGKMAEHEQRDNDRYNTLMEHMADNHDELKDLIIDKLDR